VRAGRGQAPAFEQVQHRLGLPQQTSQGQARVTQVQGQHLTRQGEACKQAHQPGAAQGQAQGDQCAGQKGAQPRIARPVLDAVQDKADEAHGMRPVPGVSEKQVQGHAAQQKNEQGEVQGQGVERFQHSVSSKDYCGASSRLSSSPVWR
jgi:hypothetical protein